MIKNGTKYVLVTSVLLGVSMPQFTFASNGLFLIGNSTKSRGMGGVSIAMTHDTLTSATNPATMAFTGNRFDMGADIFVPTAEATLGQGAVRTTVESVPEHMTIADGVYLMPGMGASWSSGDISYGFTMTGVGGGGTRYETNLFNIDDQVNLNVPVGVSLVIMNINPTITMKLDETHTIGASLVIGLQVFKAFGLEKFTTFTQDDGASGRFTDEGSEVNYGAGIRLGWLGHYMSDKLVLGAEYTSQTYMKKFDKYRNLFAEGRINTPGNIGIGAAYHYNDSLMVAMDITYVMYEDVPAISNLGPRPTGGVFPISEQVNSLGLPGGLGFGWSNQVIFEIGAQYEISSKWQLRAGWNYAESPIDERTEILFNTLAPATVQNHLTLGASWIYSKETEFSFSYVHAFENSQFGPTFIGFEGEIKMKQDSLGAALSIKF